jgi:hypothetical protein
MSIRENHFILIALATAGLFLFVWSETARAQSGSDSEPSVAEAARRAREKKKENAKPVRTLTNDDLPAAPAGDVANGAVALPPAMNGEDAVRPSANDGGAKKPSTPVNEEQRKALKANTAAALERAKKQLATALSELDLMQRKLVLDSDSYYSKTDYASDKEGKANLDAEAQAIDIKKQDIEDLKARVAELQALVGETMENAPDKSDQPEQNPPAEY